MICIDLGANVGKYTRMMAAKAKHVIAFEPDPWAHAALQANLAAFDNVSIEQAAAGTSDDTVCLYRAVGFERDPATRSQWSSTVAEKRNVAKNAALEVRQIDFVRYLDELDRKVGILKIDIEGAEVDLLEALFDRPDLLERIGHIFAETHETGIPGHRARVEALRERAKLIDRSRIFLDWG